MTNSVQSLEKGGGKWYYIGKGGGRKTPQRRIKKMFEKWVTYWASPDTNREKVVEVDAKGIIPALESASQKEFFGRDDGNWYYCYKIELKKRIN